MNARDEVDRAAFLRVLEEDPYDRDTRLVLADWLEERGEDDAALEQRRCATAAWCASRRFLEDLAGRCGQTCLSYPERSNDIDQWVSLTLETLLEAGRDYLRHGEQWVQEGSDQARDLLLDDATRAAYWHHWQVVTGQSLTKDDPDSPFSCSC